MSKIIKSENITNDEIAQWVLNNLKPYNQYLDTISEDSCEYEDLCEKVNDQFIEIEEYFTHKSKMHKCNNKNCAVVDMVLFEFWKYLKGKIKFSTLKKNVIKFSKEYED